MKIDKKNYRHWLVLAGSLVAVFCIIVLRPFLKTKNKQNKKIIFYGHTLNGNLKALYDYIKQQEGYEPYFLSMDKGYLNRLVINNEDSARLLYLLRPRDMLVIARSSAFISSHGLHFMRALKKTTDIKFFDVWHGIPYKGFVASDFEHLHDHGQSWVSSEKLKNMYVDRFGFDPSRVKVTGYGRVDQLVDGSLSDKEKLINKYKLPIRDRYVLIAPTWKQDDKGRNILPFGVSEEEFFTEIDNIAKKHNAEIIFRTHLNSQEDISIEGLSNTVFMPYAKYELAEEFLALSDVLVSDWSSISFDYLALDRPTIFLDIEPPFKNGLSFGAEYRFGDVVDDFNSLLEVLDLNLSQPEEYVVRNKDKIQKTKLAAYDQTLDGKSCERYLKELNEAL
ncbi:CDP-glycerol glycerophosphotransferase family protein [Candidatus Saccharibacteria bacterium]|nr:CDP-glycerol glycerophosphotransferase family protein [Candidatus Saccharibacteria bacterium]